MASPHLIAPVITERDESTYRNSGLATAAAAALVGQAFTLEDIDRVEIVHDAANTASGGVPRRLGFTQIERRTSAQRPVTSRRGRRRGGMAANPGMSNQPSGRPKYLINQPTRSGMSSSPACSERPVELDAAGPGSGSLRLADYSGIRRQNRRGDTRGCDADVRLRVPS
jgi:hypothetical protein